MIKREELEACFRSALYSPVPEGPSPLRFCPIVVVVLVCIMGLCGIMACAHRSKPTLVCQPRGPGVEYCWYTYETPTPTKQEKTK